MKLGARHLVGALLVAGAMFTAVMVATGSPPPMADDAWFKGPAAELAATGTLASPGITGFFEHVHEYYAAYPPLPQYLLAGLYTVLGTTLRVGILYALIVHMLSSVAVGWTSLRLLRGFAIPPRAAWAAALLTGGVWLAGDRLTDRPEELGLLFVWLDLALVGPRAPAARAAVSGALAGMAALCAPLAGVLGMFTLAGRLLASLDDAPWRSGTAAAQALARTAPPMIVGALASMAVFGSWVAWLELSHPGEFAAQFLGAMRAAEELEPYPTSAAEFLAAVARGFGHQPTVIPAVLLAAVAAPLAWRKLPVAEGGEPDRRLAAVLWSAAMLTLTLGLARRPWAYTYIWACAELLLPCLALLFARFLTDEESPTVGRGMALVVVLLAWLGPARTLYWSAAEAPAARADGAFAALHDAIPPGEPVATTSRHWNAFQGRNPWRDAIFLYKRDPALLDDCRWLVLRTGDGADQPLPEFMDQFERVAEQPSNAPDELTYAWAVYRRLE